MKVSIIMPAYNAASTLGQAIGSVLTQTASGWELIVVNDGSTDDTRAVAKALAGRRRRVRILDQSNGGESAARNTGIAAALHEWLLFLDADDWIAPAFLEIVSAALESDPTLDAVHCGWARVAQDGTHLTDQYRPPSGDLFPVLARRAAFPVHACVVRRSLVDEVGRFDVTLRKSPDWDLWQRVARSGAKFGSVPDVLAYYRMAPNSASLEAKQLLVDGLTVLRRGHAGDPRVPHPKPEYANGLAGSTVQSQEFYLLSWCAGLLLGSGEDARALLSQLDEDWYGDLYADAVAQCIFESAALPSCRSPRQWEELWSHIQEPARTYLEALEERSKTPDLARRAMSELKNLILKNSPVWGSVIEAHESQTAELRNTVARFVEGTAGLQSERDSWRDRAETAERQYVAIARELADAASQVEAIQEDRTSLKTQLGEAVAQIAAMELDRAALQTHLGQADAQIAGLQLDRTSLQTQLSEAAGRMTHLESENQASDAARQAVIEQLNEMVRQKASLEQQKGALDREIAGLEFELSRLGDDKRFLTGELGKWRQSSTDRDVLIEELQQERWVRIGLRLGILAHREVRPASLERMPAYGPGEQPESLTSREGLPNWELRMDEGCDAHVTYPREDHEMVKVDITRNASRTEWGIQLNLAGLKVEAGQEYTVVFQARSARPRTIKVGFSKAHAPWSNLGLYAKVPLTPEWQTIRTEFIALEGEDNARIHFDLGGRKIGVDVTSVSLRSGGRSTEAVDSSEAVLAAGRCA